MTDDERLRDIAKRQGMLREAIDRDRARPIRTEGFVPSIMESMYYDINWLTDQLHKATKGSK